jgi:hypothetical protein
VENFDKNWLAILLIAVVFFILGFLVGRVTGFHPGREGMVRERIIKGNLGDKDLQLEGDNGNITVKIDTLKNDGKQIEVRVEKKLKP